jgi:ribose transport system permease protein
MSGNPTVGEGFEMLVIAGVILGGTSLAGGVGTVIGTLFGVLFLQLIESGLTLLGVDPFLMMLLRGGIILLAFFASTIQQYGLLGVSRKTLATSQE